MDATGTKPTDESLTVKKKYSIKIHAVEYENGEMIVVGYKDNSGEELPQYSMVYTIDAASYFANVIKNSYDIENKNV